MQIGEIITSLKPLTYNHKITVIYRGSAANTLHRDTPENDVTHTALARYVQHAKM